MTYFTIFVANAAIMVIEILGARSLAPYFGMTSEVWAGILAAILIALGVGYWAGGVVADKAATVGIGTKSPHESLFFICGIALALCAIALLFSWALFDVIATGISFYAHFFGLTLSAMLSTLFLFGMPALCLAFLSPVLLRAQLTTLQKAATFSGRISATAAFGSIAGALASGTVLIPYFGIRRIFISTALILFVLACFYFIRAKNIRVLFGMGALFILYCIGNSNRHLLTEVHALAADIDTPYNRIWLYDAPSRKTDEHIRFLRTDPFGIQCAANVKKGIMQPELVFEYLRAFDNAFLVVPNPARMLMVGGCNFSYPYHLENLFPQTPIDVVEIDPSMQAIAHTWFGYTPQKTTTIITQDARTFFNTRTPQDPQYDVIFLDAFSSGTTIPHHLITTEMFHAVEQSLSTRGVVVINIVNTDNAEGMAYISSVMQTVQSAFTHVSLFRISTLAPYALQNFILMASNAELFPGDTISHTSPRLTSIPTTDEAFVKKGIILTDDYAPVEFMTRQERIHNAPAP